MSIRIQTEEQELRPGYAWVQKKGGRIDHISGRDENHTLCNEPVRPGFRRTYIGNQSLACEPCWKAYQVAPDLPQQTWRVTMEQVWAQTWTYDVEAADSIAAKNLAYVACKAEEPTLERAGATLEPRQTYYGSAPAVPLRAQPLEEVEKQERALKEAEEG